MPRKRMIYPTYFTSATLARVELRTMITFAGLWIYADDFGRGEDDAAFIAASVWPRRPSITAALVEDDLKTLAAADVLCRYEIGGHPLLHIPSWFEHQKVSHPTPSKLPPCPTCDRSLYTEWYRADDTETERYRKAAKARQAARTGASTARESLASRSGAGLELVPSNSGMTLPSLVQFRLVQFRRRRPQFRVGCGQPMWTAA